MKSRPRQDAEPHCSSQCQSERQLRVPLNLIRVVLADDHPIILLGLKSLLGRSPDIDVVGMAGDGLEALSLINELCPHIAVLDLTMPKLGGIGLARRLKEEGSSTKVIALTAHEDISYLRQLLEFGMGGYVLKRSASDDLPRAIRAVHGGGVYVDPVMAGGMFGGGGARLQSLPSSSLAELSEREAEVLQLTALGHSNKSIATQLNVGVKTVETYKARAMDKLGFRSRVEIVRYAAYRGWLDQN